MRPDRISEDSWPSSFVTDEEVAFLQTTKLSRKTPFLVRGVMNTQLSIARFSGGINYNGDYFGYVPDTDELIRGDVMETLMKRREKNKRAAERKEAAAQGDMFKPKPKRVSRAKRPSKEGSSQDG